MSFRQALFCNFDCGTDELITTRVIFDGCEVSGSQNSLPPVARYYIDLPHHIYAEFYALHKRIVKLYRLFMRLLTELNTLYSNCSIYIHMLHSKEFYTLMNLHHSFLYDNLNPYYHWRIMHTLFAMWKKLFCASG